jgi:hypothetical protein
LCLGSTLVAEVTVATAMAYLHRVRRFYLKLI